MGSLSPPLLRLNEDALTHVFSVFETSGGMDRVYLARCARVCKMLSPYALEALWKRLDSLSPLLDLLGDSVKVVTVDTYGYATTEYILKIEDIPDEEWKSFHEYSRLVRYLRVAHNPQAIAPVTFESLASLSEHTQQRLLPSLVELNWVDSKPFSTAFLRFASQLGGPTLDYLRLACGVVGPEMTVAYQAMLDSLVGKSPYLRRLELHGYLENRPLRFLEPCKRLTSVYIDHEDSVALLRAYAPLESLEVLDVQALRGELWPSVHGFPALELASVAATTFNLNRLFSGVTSSRLVGLNIREIGENGWEETRTLLDTIQTRFSNSLKRITLRGHAYASDEPLRLLDIIAPLLQIPDLEEVTVFFDGPVGFGWGALDFAPKFALTNSDLKDIAASWPRLRRLSLRGACAPEQAPSVDALAEFAQRCPDLQHLMLQCGHIWSPRGTHIPKTTDPTRLARAVPANHVYSLILPWANIKPAGDVGDSFFKLGVFLAATFPYCSWDLSGVKANPSVLSLVQGMQRKQSYKPLPEPEYIAELMQFRGR